MANQVGGESGGYDYEFVDPPPDTLICGICCFTSKTPQLSVCCGHTFCDLCIEGAKKLDDDFKCPLCREAFSCFTNKQADRIIKDLKVFCTHKKNGCEWQGVVRNIIDHLVKDCRFIEMDCPKGCGTSIQRQKMVWHVENECGCRIVNCQYCHTTGQYQFIEGQHRNWCLDYLMSCPNKCFSSKMPRSSIAEHLMICPLEKISCTNMCGVIFLRKDLKKHVESNCPRRVVHCQYCQHEGEQHLINGRHKEYCLKLPVKCPNDCEAGTMLREDVTMHKTICPLEKINCEYSRVGCTVRIVRKDLALHNKERMEEHLSLTSCQLDKLEKAQTNQAVVTDKALQKLNDKISMIEITHQREIDELQTELQSILEALCNKWVIKISKEATKVISGAQIMPVIIKMSGFRIKKDEGPWASDPFYSHSGGHKLRLIMNVIRSSDWLVNRKFSHFSLSLCVMHGAQERRFKRGTIKVFLLNQCSDNGHCTSLMNVWVPNLQRDVQIGKIDRFISYEDFYKTTTTCQFLQNNNIFFKLQWIQLDQISTV